VISFYDIRDKNLYPTTEEHMEGTHHPSSTLHQGSRQGTSIVEDKVAKEGIESNTKRPQGIFTPLLNFVFPWRRHQEVEA
jgi:hypothetical protein